MMRRNRHPRAGFTLIELIVVIGIIAVLMGLLISGVMKALSTRPRTETLARMKGLDTTISTFKSDRFGSGRGYIPAGLHNPANGQVVGKFRLRNSYPAGGSPGRDDFEAQYISQVFGTRVNLDNLGYNGLSADLDANQTLTFFLGGIPSWNGQGQASFTGFSKNPQQPFAPVGTQGESRIGPFLDVPSKMVALDPINNFPRLLDGYGNPFAYFVAYNGKAGLYGGYNMYAPPLGTAQPYQNGNKYVNESGYQLISAGPDNTFFGTSNNWSSLDGPSQDNLANFSTGILGSGPPTN